MSRVFFQAACGKKYLCMCDEECSMDGQIITITSLKKNLNPDCHKNCNELVMR